MRVFKKIDQKGITPILLIAAISIIILVVFLFIFISSGFNIPNLQNSNSKDNSQDCKTRDLGGCDEEPDFYDWKDDGKP